MVKYNATQEESSSSHTNFEGFYILYKDVFKDLCSVHIRTRNLLERHIINPDMYRPLKLGKELLYRYLTGIDEFDNIFIVTAQRSEDVKRLINDNNFRYLTQLYTETRDEFSLFNLENGDVGVSISNFNIFDIFQLIKSNYDVMAVRKKMTEDLLKAQLYIKASANLLHHCK